MPFPSTERILVFWLASPLSANAEHRYHQRQFGVHGYLHYHNARQKETIMRERSLGSIIMTAIAAATGISVSIVATSAQGPVGSATAPAPALKTPWGEPDLQGIWTDEFDTPLQRPAQYADQEFFTEAQREELDKERTEVLNRRAVGTPNDAYNFAVFLTTKRTGARTSKIVDPPSGRIPPLTPEAQKAAAVDREFRLVLLQATNTCKNQLPACAGGKYDPTPSPRRAEPPPRYNAVNFGRINRHDARSLRLATT